MNSQELPRKGRRHREPHAIVVCVLALALLLVRAEEPANSNNRCFNIVRDLQQKHTLPSSYLCINIYAIHIVRDLPSHTLPFFFQTQVGLPNSLLHIGNREEEERSKRNGTHTRRPTTLSICAALALFTPLVNPGLLFKATGQSRVTLSRR